MTSKTDPMRDLTDRLRSVDGWTPAADFVCREAANAIDALRAQVAALHAQARHETDCAEAYRAQVTALQAERDALRPDAERYRFVRDAERSDGIADELLLYTMESLDRCVDEAMEREAKNAAIDAARGAKGGSDAAPAAAEHDWQSTGVDTHRGEYWYRCTRCGESDWIASYGTKDQLQPRECKPRADQEPAR